MSAAESEKTLETLRLQPQIAGTDSSKYLSESLDKVKMFQNKAVNTATQEDVLEFIVNKQGYNKMMESAIPQKGSKGIDAIKYHFEGMSQTSNPTLRNLAIPGSKLDEFNALIRDVRKANGQ